jgi:uncharacterized protein YegP (UPF0339 family)
MRIEGAATTISWIPSEAVTGVVYRVPFEVTVSHYDDPPPDLLPDVENYLAADGARFANLLRAWIEVRDGEIVEFGHTGSGHIGSTTLRLGSRNLHFVAYPLRDIQDSARHGADAVRFEQTAGGRTGVPAPRRVSHRPYVQFQAPLAWSTVALTLYADGRQECELTGASPFPRHWLYDGAGTLVRKSATIDYRTWSTTAFGRHSPWGDTDSPAMVSEVETALERQLSLRIMRDHRKPELRRLSAGEHLTTQHEADDRLYLLLDGVLRVEVDDEPLAEVGPGAVVGERATLGDGRRTSSLIAATKCLVAAVDPALIDRAALTELSAGHRRENISNPSPDPRDDVRMQPMTARFETYQDDDGQYRFRLEAASGDVVAESPVYETVADAVAGMDALKRAAAEADVPDGDVLPGDPDTGIHMHY